MVTVKRHTRIQNKFLTDSLVRSLFVLPSLSRPRTRLLFQAKSRFGLLFQAFPKCGEFLHGFKCTPHKCKCATCIAITGRQQPANYTECSVRKISVFTSKRTVAFVCHVHNFIIIFFRIKIQERLTLLKITLISLLFRRLCLDTKALSMLAGRSLKGNAVLLPISECFHCVCFLVLHFLCVQYLMCRFCFFSKAFCFFLFIFPCKFIAVLYAKAKISPGYGNAWELCFWELVVLPGKLHCSLKFEI